MRILAVSDLHYRLPTTTGWNAADGGRQWPSWAILPTSSAPALGVQTVVLEKYLGLLADKAVVLASGNHDLDGGGEHGEQVASWLRSAMRQRAQAACRSTSATPHDLPLVGQSRARPWRQWRQQQSTVARWVSYHCRRPDAVVQGRRRGS